MRQRTIDAARRGFRKRLRKLQGDRAMRTYARELGMNHVQLHRLYSGVEPRMELLLRIADHGGVSLDWLILGRTADGAATPSARTATS